MFQAKAIKQQFKPNDAKTAFFQPKLTINQPNDAYEQEADAMADHVMRMPDPSFNNNNNFFKPSVSSVQRKCAHCEEEEKKAQRKENGELVSTENYGQTKNYLSLNSEKTVQQNKYVNNLTAQTAPVIQRQSNRQALTEELQRVRQRLSQLRNRQTQLSDDFARSSVDERQRQSLESGRQDLQRRARSDAAANALWGGSFAAESIRRAVTVSQSGNTVNLSVRLQITYLALPDAAARQRAVNDIPRIQSAIQNVWQVNISTGEYAGVSFRVTPTVTYLPNAQARSTDSFLIQVRAPDTGPSSGDSVSGIISLAPVHLDGNRVIVTAHELAHLFGFMDAYLSMTTRGPGGRNIEQWSVARRDAANRADLLGLIDPVVLQRLLNQGAITQQDLARQTGPVHIWDDEASTVLRVLGVVPPPPARPGPDSEDFDPQAELDRTRQEGERRLSQIRERRSRIDNSTQWLEITEEIIRLEQRERELTTQLGTP